MQSMGTPCSDTVFNNEKYERDGNLQPADRGIL